MEHRQTAANPYIGHFVMATIVSVSLIAAVTSSPTSLLSSENAATTTTTTTTNNNNNSSSSSSSNHNHTDDSDTSDLNSTTLYNNWDSNSSFSATTTPEPTTTPPPLRRCKFQVKQLNGSSLFFVEQHKLQMQSFNFIISETETRCYLTRSDLERTMDGNYTEDLIVALAMSCYNHAGTDLLFFEDEQVEDDLNSAGSFQNSSDTEQDNSSASSSDEYNSSPNSTCSGQESDSSNTTCHRHYPRVISYFQSGRCRISVKGPQMVAEMSELRVLAVIGERGWNLTELAHNPQLCTTFRNVVALSILSDTTTQSYLQELAVCKPYLKEVVEMILTNDSLTSFPDLLHSAVPNLRALDININNLTAPVSFPWPSGFATLPRNLSRTYQFNEYYNFRNSFDMQPNLFRRTFRLDGNRIRNITHFQFTSDFQYISVERNGLAEISEDVFSLVLDVQFISLAYNELTSLPGSIFSRLLRLRRLDLNNNKLTIVPAGLFKQLRQLEILHLENNRLQTIEGGAFADLEGLKELKLQGNLLMHIPDGAFSLLSVKLNSIELQNNPLTVFPYFLLLLRGLLTTNLDYTNITDLDFVAMEAAPTIDLSLLANALKNPTTGEFVDIKEDPAFQKVISLRHSNLKTVRLYNSSLYTLSMFLLVVKHFTIITDNSQLACDCNILNVTHKLQTWRQDGTLSGKEACLTGWKCMWPTELKGKALVTLKDEQTYCPLPEETSTGGRRTSSCPEGCKCYVRTKVETVIVDCQNADLKALPERVPDNTRELWLQNNSIIALQKLPYLRHLYSLKLTANHVQELPMDVLLSMTNLRVLHVDDNWLTSLLQDFASLKQLSDVRLAGNPFRCDCHTLWMKEWLWLHQGIVGDVAQIKCSVEDSDGKTLTSVPDSQFVCIAAASLTQLAVPIATPLTLAFVLLTLAVVTFLYRRRLKVLLYIHTGLHPFDRDPADSDALYDVTVVCNVTARAWVLRHLVETLEGEGGYKVFFYDRDALVGQMTSENVRQCVQQSRRLVAVLDKGWRENDLLHCAVQQSLAKCRSDMVHFLTLIVHQCSAQDIVDTPDKHNALHPDNGDTNTNSDEDDLRQMIKRRRYIASDDKHMAKKLLYEMPHLKTSAGIKPQAGLSDNKNVEKAGKRVESQLSMETVPLHDIVAAAKNEENAWMEGKVVKLSNNQLYRDAAPENVSIVIKGEGIGSTSDKVRKQIGEDEEEIEEGSGEVMNEDKLAENGCVVHNHNGLDRHVSVTSSRLSGLEDQRLNVYQHQWSVESQVSLTVRWVFVWYTVPDLPFTLKSIVEPLERRGHTCILQDRDFAVGAAIQENIVNAAQTCPRAVLVLSNHLVKDDWFTFVFHVVFDRFQQSRDRRVALVTREHLVVTGFVEEVQQVIRTSAVLDEHDPWFAKRLRQFVH